MEFIEEHLAEEISLAALAELVNLSLFHFARAFKQSFGVPPHRYHWPAGWIAPGACCRGRRFQ